ncbi:MAG: chromosome segregation protein SMC [Myxococcota bacterium]|nr:chromosome segregation protein SMC [Myxococcota bacterium]
MRIRKLELQGFKSFVDRQTFHFGDGIAGVVGPNGCGKSNVADAIKWCLGEQSARQLRGGAMQDVIFSGSECRSPVGMAEVSLTFAASGEAFPGQWARYEEVAVTRRLYRDGTSEYLINQEKVRRRDIQDLFLDTGVANSLYSFIEQGRVGKMVSAKPEERRALLEEAAGISRYKARRAETLSKLASTEGNLERATDVCDEMGRRLRTLERQVEKAARYRRLGARVRQGEIFLGLVKFSGLAGDRKALRDDLREARADAEKFGRELEARDADLEVHREEIAVLEALVGGLRDELSELEAERRESESARHYQGKARDELVIRIDVLAHDIEDLTRQHDRAQEDSERIGSELGTQQGLLDGADVRLTECREQAAETGGLLQEQKTEFEAAKDKVLKLVTGLTRRKAVVSSKEQRFEELTARREELGRDGVSSLENLDVARESLAAVEAEAEKAREALDIAKKDLERVREALKTEEALLSEERSSLGELDLQRLESERSFAGDEARLHSLQDLQQAHADFEDGARAILESSSNLGTLAEHLVVPEELQERVEFALGDSLSHVLFEKESELLAAAAKGREGSRTGLVCIESATAHGGWAADLAGSEAGGKALGRLLDCWGQAKDLKTGLAQWKKTGQGVITDDGMVIGVDGVVHVGRQSPGSGAAVLRRQREITEIAARLEETGAALEALRQESDAARERVSKIGKTVVSRREEVEAFRVAFRDAQLALGEAEHRVREDKGALDRENSQAQALEAQRGSIDATISQIESTLADEKRLVEAEEIELADTEERTAKLRTEVIEIESRASRARELLARAEAEQQGANQQVQLLKSTLEGVTAQATSALERLERTRTEREEAIGRISNLGEDDVRLNQRIQELGESQGELRTRLKEGTDQLTAVRQTLTTAEESLRGLRESKEDASVRKSELELKVQEARLHIENLREQVEERYQVSLPGLLDKLEREAFLAIEVGEVIQTDLPVDEDKLPQVSDLRITPELLESREDVERWVRSLAEDRRGIERLGEVNLAALEEYEELIERYNYLVAQREDLEESVEAIRRAIAEINRTCRERFKDAYDQVSEHFERMYPTLVGGGKARLVLTDEDDLLETGVDIFVQPPGKRLQNLSLLSGGEKAMTAIALIFSLFMVKPSPFCLLDEVDAPLDEGNGGRFNDMLKEMSERSQFIVITHNKKTMEAVDTLYGVTMPDPGISRLVTVQIH